MQCSAIQWRSNNLSRNFRSRLTGRVYYAETGMPDQKTRARPSPRSTKHVGSYQYRLSRAWRKSSQYFRCRRGGTALQPSYVEDVADAVVRILEAPSLEPIYELGGPRIYRYRELVQTLARQLGTRSALISVPFWTWKIPALVAEGLPRAPLRRNQIELMQIDNVASLELPGFAALGIAPTGIEAILAAQGRSTTRWSADLV